MAAQRNDDGEELIECSMCHEHVPKRQILRIGGRELCPSCAASWFDEDEQGDE